MSYEENMAIQEGLEEYGEEQESQRETRLRQVREAKIKKFAIDYLEEMKKRGHEEYSKEVVGFVAKDLTGYTTNCGLCSTTDCDFINQPHVCASLGLKIIEWDNQGNKLEIISTKQD